MRAKIITLLGGAAAIMTGGAAVAQTLPSYDFGYADYVACADGYGGAVGVNGYPLADVVEAAKYPNSETQNVHVHVENEAHEIAVRVCAMKVAHEAQATGQGHVVVIDQTGRIVRVTKPVDMADLAKRYADYVLGQG